MIAASTERFGELLADHPRFRVPRVVRELCSDHVLTTELMPGVPIERMRDAPQAVRDQVRQP